MNRDQLHNELPEPVRRYFEEEVARLEPPNDLMHTTMAEIESEPRVNRFSLGGISPLATGLAAVAVIAALVLGFNLFNRGGTAGPGGTPQPTATPSPTPLAHGHQLRNLVTVGSQIDPRQENLPPGGYYIGPPDTPFFAEFTLPDGWWYWQGAADVHAVLINSLDSGASEGSAWGFGFAWIGNVPSDPCDPSTSMFPTWYQGGSVGQLIRGIKTWSHFDVHVEKVSVAGFPAKRVTVTAKEPMTCSPVLFTTPSGYSYPIDPSGQATDTPEQMTFVDVNGKALAMWTTDYAPRNAFEIRGGASPDPLAHVQDQVELHQILDSMVISPG
jgi:hypothetical protein